MSRVGKPGDTTHTHQCRCGETWTHERPRDSDEAYRLAHLCPLCGADVRWHATRCPCWSCRVDRSGTELERALRNLLVTWGIL